MFSKRTKIASAAVGASAAIALGALGLATSSISSAQYGPNAPSPTLGETVTAASVPPSEEATAEAKPSLKGPAPLPSEEQGLPG